MQETLSDRIVEDVRDGRMAVALEKYTGAWNTQYSTSVRGGKKGFTEFFTAFLEPNPIRDIQVLRTIEDGQFVFCHVYQGLNNGEAKWVTADIFDTDADGKIVEHWDAIAEFKWPTVSGRSMVDGSNDIEDLDQTEANKAVVRGFVGNVLIGGQTNLISNYIPAVQFDQHNPERDDGLTGFSEHLRKTSDSELVVRYLKVHRLLGQGNFVAVFSRVKQGEEDWAVMDLVSLNSGKIVEHWDVQENIGPVETWNNSGKF